MKTFKRYYNQPLYAIFRRDADGTLWGCTENSFSISWSKDTVRVWTRQDLATMHRRHEKIKNWLGCSNCFMSRVSSKNCPADIVLEPMTDQTTKYNWRNKKFLTKQR